MKTLGITLLDALERSVHLQDTQDRPNGRGAEEHDVHVRDVVRLCDYQWSHSLEWNIWSVVLEKQVHYTVFSVHQKEISFTLHWNNQILTHGAFSQLNVFQIYDLPNIFFFNWFDSRCIKSGAPDQRQYRVDNSFLKGMSPLFSGCLETCRLWWWS